ncbi:MAG: fumarylacetoacetate hydrolase family protein [Ardenticatenia bacterium]|nr:fumarylacetoacetate hydrolase family protein [Ardenticatenia bacterium]
MRVRRVRLRREPPTYSVAVEREEAWVPLIPALERASSVHFPTLDRVAHDVIAFLQAGREARDEANRLLDLMAGETFANSFDPTPVLPFEPRTFRDFMLYEEHAVAAARGLVKQFMPKVWPMFALYERITGRPHPKLRPKPIWYEKPIYYMGSPINFYTEGETVPWPSYTRALDYELELGVLIVRPLYNAAPAEALQAVGGFVVINDFSARDVQYPEMTSGFGPVKAKNFANAMSMTVVTADEVLPYVENLRAEVTVNGRSWGTGTSAGAQHSLGEMVAYASLEEKVVPGELMATGTIPGCSGMETGRWLSPGDHITLSIERVGSLSNRVGAREESTA